MAVKLTVLGSADAFNSGGRGNASYLVEDSRGAFCVDFGPTALMGLKRQGFEPARLDFVLLTHLHGDHFGGLHLLFIDAQYRAFRARPLTVCGPVGTRERVEAWYRLAYGSSASKRQFETVYRELAPGERATVLGRRVRSFPAAHMEPADGALQLRVRTDERVLAFTGDSAWTERMPELARDADLLVCECTEERGLLTEQHLSWETLRPRLRSLEARRIVLTHLGPEMREAAGRLRAPRVSFAEDGLAFSLPARRSPQKVHSRRA